jgi:hypothetical protein
MKGKTSRKKELNQRIEVILSERISRIQTPKSPNSTKLPFSAQAILPPVDETVSPHVESLELTFLADRVHRL